MKTHVSIRFWFRRKRVMSDISAATEGGLRAEPTELGNICCRVTVAGREVNFSTHTPDVAYGDWNAKAQRVAGRKPAVVTVNAALTKMQDALTDIWADLERQGKSVTSRAIVRTYQRGGSSLDMIALYEAFMTERETLVGIDIALSTSQVAASRLVLLKAFLAAHKISDLRPEEFTHNLADKLLYWMLQERGFARNYANKVVQTMSQVLRWGVRREHIDKNPLDLYQLKAAAAAEIKYLNVGELHLLTAWQPTRVQLERSRDCFVFQCWTGLAYADLLALDMARDAEYHKDKSGNLRRVLRVRRSKSTTFKGYECVIPLLPEAERILAKYNDELPVVSNAGYNMNLKEIGRACNLAPDKMTTHVGRKTAGVMMLNAGIRMETVSKFLGHSSVRMTEKVYAKILDTTVVDDFGALFGGGQNLLKGGAAL
jgi:integrase/recombinase XerD